MTDRSLPFMLRHGYSIWSVAVGMCATFVGYHVSCSVVNGLWHWTFVVPFVILLVWAVRLRDKSVRDLAYLSYLKRITEVMTQVRKAAERGDLPIETLEHRFVQLSALFDAALERQRALETAPEDYAPAR